MQSVLFSAEMYSAVIYRKICEVTFYNEIRDHDFVYNLHQSYVTRDDFIGFEIE